MNKVFVAHHKSHDITSAKIYGELVILTEGVVSVFKTDSLVVEITKKMEDSTVDDFLLLSGAPIINCIAFTTQLLKFGIVQTLIFNAKTREYVCRTITEQQFGERR